MARSGHVSFIGKKTNQFTTAGCRKNPILDPVLTKEEAEHFVSTKKNGGAGGCYIAEPEAAIPFLLELFTRSMEARIHSPSTQVRQMKADDVAGAALSGSLKAQVGTIKVKTVQFRRTVNAGRRFNDQEIFIQRANFFGCRRCPAVVPPRIMKSA